ncbi:MAG: hypothetical protein OEU36_06100 [Gammaproteobacteria bacterium]|nr:hypothetical protein [Gammaproteobacteria bacterium]
MLNRIIQLILLVLVSVLVCVNAVGNSDNESIEQKVERISSKVAELRNLQFKHPVSASIQTQDEFVHFARREIESTYGLEALHAMSQAYQLLGLLDPGVDLLSAYLNAMRGLIGGFYSSQGRTLYVMSGFEHGGMTDVILAHELTHALDDQHFDLERMRQQVLTHSDREFAFSSAVEGSAMVVMNSYVISGLLEGFLQIDPSAAMNMMTGQLDVLRDVPPFIAISLMLPYSEGASFLTRDAQSVMSGTLDTQPIDQALRELPHSSEQILHPEKYWDPVLRDEPVEIDLPDFASSLGSGWSLVESNTLGELGVFLLVQVGVLNVEQMITAQGQWTNQAATGWGGDRYQLYAGPDGELLMVWFSRWDSAQDRDELVQALQEVAKPTMAALRRVDQHEDTGVVVYLANSEAIGAVDRLSEAFLESQR